MKNLSVHITLDENQREWLKAEYPSAGISKALRKIIANHIRQVENARGAGIHEIEKEVEL